MSFVIKTDASPSTSLMLAYGFLALPLAFAGLPLYIHIPDFYTREMGLGIASAGLILMVLRCLDALQDPLIGYISDKSAALQRFIMGLGFIALLIGMGGLSMGPPSFVTVGYWFAGTIGLTALGLSMVNINLVMIGSLWNANEEIRGRASGMREGLSLIGMLLASVLPSILILSMSKADAFNIFYFIFVALLITGAIAFSLFYKNLPNNHAIISKEKNISIRLPCRFFIQNKG
jgi:Na+/melibiose symporter-like transporter